MMGKIFPIIFLSFKMKINKKFKKLYNYSVKKKREKQCSELNSDIRMITPIGSGETGNAP